MALSYTYDGAAVTHKVPPSLISIPQRAENGEPSFGGIPIEDPTATLVMLGHRPFIVAESACSQPRLFTGYVAQRDMGRSYEQTQWVGADPRLFDTTIVDQNAIFGFRVIWDADGNRPEETWDERLAWILGSDYMSGLFGGDTTWIDSHDNPMDAADYRGATPGAVFDDLINRFPGAMNFFAAWNPATSAVEIAVFGIDDVTGACTLSISNLESEIDASTIFAPDMVAKLAREPDQVYSSVIVEYANGKVYRTLPATATTYIERGTTISRPYTGKASTAQAQGDQFLLSHSAERDRITCVMQSVPEASVGLVRAGMSIDVRFTHLPDYAADFVTMRIVACAPVPVSDLGTLYDISLELVGGAPAPTPPTFHQAVICSGAGSKTTSITGNGTTTINFGGSTGSPFTAPPVIQDTDGYSGVSGDWQVGGADVTTLTIPAGLDGTYRVGLEAISWLNDWWLEGGAPPATDNPQQVAYIPGNADAACGNGVQAGTSSVAYSVCVNGVPVTTGTWTRTGGLAYVNPRAYAPGVEVALVEDDEITATITMSGDIWAFYNCGDSYGNHVPAALFGVLYLTLIEGSSTSGGPIVPPVPTHPTTTTSTMDPTVTDDESNGFAVGDLWINSSDGSQWVLVDSTTGAAVWVSTTYVTTWNFSTSDGVTTVDPTTELTFVGATLEDLGSGVARVTLAATNAVTNIDGGKEVVNTVAASGAVETLDLADGNVHDVTLTADCTLTFAGATNGVACSFTLLLRQDGTGGWTTTWPGSVVWAGGSAPTLDETASTVAVLTFFTLDGGTNWYGFPTGGGGTPATTVESETTLGIAAAVGSDTEYARQDHTHGSPSTATISAAGFVGQILISDSPSTPLVFADLIQNEAEDDLVYADP